VRTLSVESEESTGHGGRSRRSVALRLDGRPWLRVTPGELLELGVRAGDQLDDERRAELEHALERTRARLFVVRSLTARAQSVREIEAKLAARRVPDDLARETVSLAIEHGYLDDRELAEQLARGHRTRGYGRRRAAQALRARGLDDALATVALDEVYRDDDETSQALAVLGRRSFGEGDAGRRRAAAFLARRGFSPAAAWAAVHAREERPE
jgi:regulatory protein